MILNPKFSSNEIAKSSDFEKINEREIKNIEAIFNEISAGTTKDSIARGLVVQQRGTPSMNVDITAGLGFCLSTSRMTYNDSLFGPVAITNGGASDRIDTLEIRLLETDISQEQRAFKNPSTGAITYQDVYTETEIEIETQTVEGTEGSGIAPNHTSGWIKIAEIHVDAGESTSILNADIENCSAYYEGEETTLWTAEKDATFITKNLSGIKALLRNFVNESGTILAPNNSATGDKILFYGSDFKIKVFATSLNYEVPSNAYHAFKINETENLRVNEYGIGVNGLSPNVTVALRVSGNAELSGGIATGGNSDKLAWKVIEIGDWDMSTNPAKNVTHGITNYKNIRQVNVCIRDDTDNEYTYFTGATTPSTTTSMGFSRVRISSVNGTQYISMDRVSGGLFDSGAYDSTSYNRGWIIVLYKV